ncbi:unnamed protein product, partial [Prunus brigantina]
SRIRIPYRPLQIPTHRKPAFNTGLPTNLLSLTYNRAREEDKFAVHSGKTPQKLFILMPRCFKLVTLVKSQIKLKSLSPPLPRLLENCPQIESLEAREFSSDKKFIYLFKITVQRTELNSPLGLEVQLGITEAICPAISEPGLRALLRSMTGLYVCLNRGDAFSNTQQLFELRLASTANHGVVQPREKEEGEETNLIHVMARPEVAGVGDGDSGSFSRNFTSFQPKILGFSSCEND